MTCWLLIVEGASSFLHVCTIVVDSLRRCIQASNSGRFKRRRNPCKICRKNFLRCLVTVLATSLFQFSPVPRFISSHAYSCRNTVIASVKKAKEDKRRAKEQYDLFDKLENVGYCFNRMQISENAEESWTSKREIGSIEMCCENFSW